MSWFLVPEDMPPDFTYDVRQNSCVGMPFYDAGKTMVRRGAEFPAFGVRGSLNEYIQSGR